MAIARTDDEIIKFLKTKSVIDIDTGCINFIGGKDKDGYGQVCYKNKNIRAHRLAFKLFKGELIDGLVIMHSCDNPSCINPDHLSQVEQIVNNNDKMFKGRHNVASGDDHYMRKNRLVRAGEKCPTVKLTESSVLEIRKLFNAGVKQPALAKMFSVSRTCISAIVTRRNWQHI